MRAYNAHNNVYLLDHLVSKGCLSLDDVVFNFNDIVKQTGITKPEAIIIMWNGYFYLCGREVISNALEREKALAKHSEHYRTSSMFTPTVIKLNQCLRLHETQRGLIEKTLDNH